jgi:hypothetical protein
MCCPCVFSACEQVRQLPHKGDNQLCNCVCVRPLNVVGMKTTTGLSDNLAFVVLCNPLLFCVCH